MSSLIDQMSQHGVAIVFVNVLVQQLGAPLPAVPTVVVAASLAARGRLSVASLFAAAMLAILIADSTWFLLGRRYGRRVLSFLLGFFPGRESLLARFRLTWIPFAKLIPGLRMLAPPLAGSLGYELRAFIAYDLLAAASWSGLTIGAGLLFHEQVDQLLAVVASLQGTVVLFAALTLSGLLAWKAWQHRRRAPILKREDLAASNVHR
jgi:membrane protein DedA with SNARE-associated domain